MAYNVEIVEPKLFAGVVADEIVASIHDTLSEHPKCSLVLAGGSTPSAIYRALARPPRVTEVNWEKVQLYWGDERFGQSGEVQSNYTMVSETLLSFLPTPGPQVYRVDTSLGTPQASAAAYAELIASSQNVAQGAVPVFDVVLLGIGTDGHTASIFPGSSLCAWPGADSDRQPLCAAMPYPAQEGSFRITLSPAALFSARKIVFIVRGVAKAPIVKRVLQGEEDSSALPARMFTAVADKVTWFVDSEAAQHLSS